MMTLVISSTAAIMTTAAVTPMIVSFLVFAAFSFASCAAKSAQCTPPSYVPLSARHFPRDERDEKACRKRDGRTFSARFQDAFFRVAHACATRCRFTGNRYRYKHTISIIHHTTAFYNAAAKFFRKQNEVFPQAKFSGPPVGRCVELPPNPPEEPASSLALLRFASSFSGDICITL